MASSESMKMRRRSSRSDGISAAETMMGLETDSSFPPVPGDKPAAPVIDEALAYEDYMMGIEGPVPGRAMADTEARLSWRENLQNRPVGLAGLLDKRGEVDLQNIVPVLHDEATRKAYGKKQANLKAYVSSWQTPTYEQVVGDSNRELQEYLASGIPRERVQGANMPVVTMPNYSPLTGVDLEQPLGPENTAEQAYNVYSRAMDNPAHEGFHRLIRDRKSRLNKVDQSRIKSQIPFQDKYDWLNIEHMFLRGVKYVLAPDALKSDPRFKKAVDKTITDGYNVMVEAAKGDQKGRRLKKHLNSFINDPEVRSYFHFKKDSDLAEKPKDKYYERVEKSYNNMVDILQPPDSESPQEAVPTDDSSWWDRIFSSSKNKGGYVMSGAETMMGLD